MTHTPLQCALALPRFDGRQSRLADAIGTSQQNISNWVARGSQIPAEFVLKAETETGIPRHVWRPDIYPPEEYAALVKIEAAAPQTEYVARAKAAASYPEHAPTPAKASPQEAAA